MARQNAEPARGARHVDLINIVRENNALSGDNFVPKWRKLIMNDKFMNYELRQKAVRRFITLEFII